MAASWWEVIYTTLSGRDVTGHGIKVVQAASASAALATIPGAVGTVNGPYATQALAQAQADKDQAAQSAGTETSSGGTGTSNNPKTNVNPGSLLGTLAGFLGVGKISGTNLVIRGLKIIVGGILLITGLVHLTGLSGDLADTVRKVPLPV